LSTEQALLLKPFVDRKLSAEGVNCFEKEKALSVLLKCVFGNKLVEAYKVIYVY